MTREQKYPDTDTFRYYNANPKGKITTDCVIRAISTATEIPYDDVLRGLVEMEIKTGYHLDDDKCYSRYLASIGWVKMAQPRFPSGLKYTGKDFCRRHEDAKRCVAHIGGHHAVAIVDGKVLDIWNSTGGCIGNYWVKG